jgi:hypothetical protein
MVGLPNRPHSYQAPEWGRNHGRMQVRPTWIARFAAFAIRRGRDLPGSIDKIADRIDGRH